MTHKFWGFTRRTKWNVKCFHHQVLQQSTKPSFYLLTFQIIGSLTLQQPRCLITQQHRGVIISSQQVYVLYVFIGTCSVVTQQSLWDNGAKLQLSAVLNLATRGSTTLSLTWETSKWILSQLKDLKSGQVWGPRSGSKVRVRVQGPVSFSASPRLTKMERVLLQNHPVNQPQPNVGGRGVTWTSHCVRGHHPTRPSGIQFHLFSDVSVRKKIHHPNPKLLIRLLPQEVTVCVLPEPGLD